MLSAYTGTSDGGMVAQVYVQKYPGETGGTRADLHRRAGREYHQEPEKVILLCAAGTVVPEALQL